MCITRCLNNMLHKNIPQLYLTLIERIHISVVESGFSYFYFFFLVVVDVSQAVFSPPWRHTPMPMHVDRVCVVQQITSLHSYFGHMGCQSLTAAACSLAETCASLQDDQTAFEVVTLVPGGIKEARTKADGSQADGAVHSQLSPVCAAHFIRTLESRLCAGQSQDCALSAL